MGRPFRLKERIRSFGYAFQGIGFMIRSQPNARVHLLATVAAVGAGIYFQISRGDWIGLTLAIMAVWIAEALNTAVECLADVIHPGFHPTIGKAKDVAAGAVFLAALGAVIVGLCVFGPHVQSSMYSRAIQDAPDKTER